ncbi:MAG: DUF167 domain-containing protein, partial [Candidatus Geothermarchaeales archaeon]
MTSRKSYGVKVVFGSKHLEVHGDSIRIGLTSKPEKGRANRELVKRPARHFRVGTDRIRIVAGFT